MGSLVHGLCQPMWSLKGDGRPMFPFPKCHMEEESASSTSITRQSSRCSPGNLTSRRAYRCSPGNLTSRRAYRCSPGNLTSRRANRCSHGNLTSRHAYRCSPGNLTSRRAYRCSHGNLTSRHAYPTTNGALFVGLKLKHRRQYTLIRYRGSVFWTSLYKTHICDGDGLRTRNLFIYF